MSQRITPFDTVAIDPKNIKLVFLEVQRLIWIDKHLDSGGFGF